MSESLPKPYGNYILEERIAFGGMAEVFRARTNTKGFNKEVCIKRILSHLATDANLRAMFRDEASVMAKLSHPNIVQVFDFGIQDESPFLVMELIDGEDLNSIFQQAKTAGQRLSVAEVLAVGKDVCLGLHYAHNVMSDDGVAMNLVHRDISPHNIIISKGGEVKVMDFGIALGTEREAVTQTGAVKGKMPYMSPEQAEGARDLDHRTDQFATAIVLWEMLTGKRLFGREGGPGHLALMAILKGDPIAPPSTYRDDVPLAVDAIILKALSRNREERFETMRHLHMALSKQLFMLGPDFDLGSLTTRFQTAPPAPASQTGLNAELYSGSYGSDDDKSSAYGTPSAIMRNAGGEKYISLIRELEIAHPYENFSDLAERFTALRGLAGIRPWDPFQLLSSVTGVAPDDIGGEDWSPPPSIAHQPRFQIAAFLVNAFMSRGPSPASDEVKSHWSTEDKAAYISVFRHFYPNTEGRNLASAVEEFQEITKIRRRGSQ